MIAKTLNMLSGKKKKTAVLCGMRIPKDYFITTGKGESDITIHAGSYHLALKDAGIERCNIMTYSSIMPAIATEVPKGRLIHGAVMETIMAVAHSKKGEPATAGIIYGWLYNKITGMRYGGLVCEHNGNFEMDELKKKLHSSLRELYENGFSEEYTLEDIQTITETFTPKKKHGTALAAICFTNYVFPIVN